MPVRRLKPRGRGPEGLCCSESPSSVLIASCVQTKDQYITWAAKKIETDPNFFKAGGSVFQSEAANLTKMSGSAVSGGSGMNLDSSLVS